MKKLSAFLTVLLLFSVPSFATDQPDEAQLKKDIRHAVFETMIFKDRPAEISTDAMVDKVMAAGVVNPNDYDNAEHQDDYLAAYNWMNELLTANRLTQVATDYLNKNQLENKIRGYETVLGWPGALANLKTKIDTCLNPAVRICDESKYDVRGFVKKYNNYVIYLANAYVKALQPFVDAKVKELYE